MLSAEVATLLALAVGDDLFLIEADSAGVEIVLRDARTKDIVRHSVEATAGREACAVIQAQGTDDLWILTLNLQHGAAD